MNLKLMPSLSDALRILTEKTGRDWSRAEFFDAVIDHSLPLRATTPSDCWPVIESMGKQYNANLPELGYRRHALLSANAIKNLAMHNEAATKDVALEPGDTNFMSWPDIQARQAALASELEQMPQALAAEDWDKRSVVYMGESDVVVLSAWVTVTDDTCRVPPETVEKLLTLAPAKGKRSPGSATSGLRHRMVRNSLDGAIQAAIKLATSTNVSDVWVHLRELAKDGVPPFAGLVEGANLYFIDDNNESKTLSKDALRKRLDKYRQHAE